MRLDSYLAKCGFSSRRKAKNIIKSGKVAVDNHPVVAPGFSIDIEKSKVSIDGKLLTKDMPKYFLMYKPKGYLTTLYDPQGRATIRSLLPPIKERVFPVGRLDLNTEGLLILTNDGELAFRLTHPKFEKEKEYLVYAKGRIPEARIKQLKVGVKLDDGLTYPASIKKYKYLPEKNISSVCLVIHEGRKRQIRRMFKKIGFPVVSLKRTRFSFLTLKGLKPGQVRSLTHEEIERLRKDAGLC